MGKGHEQTVVKCQQIDEKKMFRFTIHQGNVNKYQNEHFPSPGYNGHHTEIRKYYPDSDVMEKVNIVNVCFKCKLVQPCERQYGDSSGI